MGSLMAIIQRFSQSTVVWSWAMNGLRLATGILVLPLLISHLSKPDFGMYFIFVSLSALIPIIDFGFSVSIGRAVSYAMGGATELKPQGMATSQSNASPNYTLLWQLHQVTRRLYQILALGTTILLGIFGTINVALRVNETSSPTLTWLAWGVTLVAAVFEIYMGWWNVFLNNMNQVRVGTQTAALTLVIRIGLSCALLLVGAGLLSIPMASLVSSFLLRTWSRRLVLRHLRNPPGDLDRLQIKKLFATLWPNSWRIGLQFVSGYLATNANTLVCQSVFGLAASAEYGFSLQLMSICSGMASVWTVVKWPLIGQYRIKQDHAALQRVIWPRIWLQHLTYWGLALTAIVLVPILLRWSHSGKTLLPIVWLSLLALNSFLEITYSFWGTLISTENRTPFVRPIVIANITSFAIMLILVHTTRLGLAAFVLAPLVIGCFYNFWKWPHEGARSIGVSWLRFMLKGPKSVCLLIATVFMLSPGLAAESKYYAATNIWNVQVGDHNESSPALDTNGNIYVTTTEGKLFAINPDGATRWSYKFGFESVSTPAIGDDGTIYFGCRNRRFYAVAPAGKLRWSFPTGNWVDASPALGTNGTVYFGSWDKKFYALNRAGKLFWEFATGGPITSSAAIDLSGVIYFGSHDRKLYALRPDGTKKWEFITEGAILSSPAIGAEGTLYFTSADGQLWALNPDGTLRWKLRTGGINPCSPVLGLNETVFLGINSNHCAVSAGGKLLWAHHMSPNGYPPFGWIVATPVALADGAAITGGWDSLLSAYDQSGRRWHTYLNAAIWASPVITADGKVYCVTIDKALHAFTNFPGPAPSSWPMFRANAQRTGRVAVER